MLHFCHHTITLTSADLSSVILSTSLCRPQWTNVSISDNFQLIKVIICVMYLQHCNVSLCIYSKCV